MSMWIVAHAYLAMEGTAQDHGIVFTGLHSSSQYSGSRRLDLRMRVSTVEECSKYDDGG